MYGGTTRGRGSQLEGGRTKRELAAEMLAEQRKKRLSNITRSIHEFRDEKYNNRLEKLDRGRKRLPVSPRKQPHREAAAELDYCHSDSEDMDSDVSTDSLGYEEVIGKYGVQVTDTEINEINSGVDREEFRDKTKKKRKFIRNQGVKHLLY